MDPLLSALGSYNIVEANVKGAKKRKIRTVEDINLVSKIISPIIRGLISFHYLHQDDLWPLEFAEVQKVVTATRQAANQGHKNMIVRLLHRMKVNLGSIWPSFHESD